MHGPRDSTMTERILKDHQAILDQKFHEYKLAALTGLMSQWNPDNFTGKDAEQVADVCQRIAVKMEKVSQACEGGS